MFGKRKNKKVRKKPNTFVQVANAFMTLIILGIVIAGGLLYYGINQFNAAGPVKEETIFAVPQGAGVSTIARKLEDEGLITNSFIFRFGAVALDKDTELKAGEFRIAADSSMREILTELSEGRAIQYNVTIPEGFTSWQIVERLRAAELLTGEIENIPAEGTLLPNTYNFERGATRQSVLDQMKEAHDEALAEIWENRDEGLPIETPEELVILASIVEKETGLAEERPEVAGVFINRLNRGMRLQSDPTIIYGITKGEGTLGRGLKRSEIDTKTDYNTYQIDGLPIGPIANPGIESMKAVANPAETDALYFVADGSGGHAFAKTYDEHRANVAKWRQIEKERQEAAEAAAEAEKEELQRQEAEKLDEKSSDSAE
ncbi:endolytic transglycosylase MltG [Maritalea mediterranea]|uniref:Endolytic murein transglycosylase n=1 Tax=Maritalea mediterranea TaxID=2909667 RepID=A0ABS9E9L0_9HYPH|nr:endolytic transglycosylase MltG [Maritalea mediterranea]MCF4098088.1 endolytic transglycosylase MltG [Maritalea mediterranea]